MSDPTVSAPPVRCVVCGNDNPAQNVYCGKCGALLDAQGAAFAERVRAVLKTELKDRDVVEMETTQAVVERLTAWAKTFAFLMAIPLAILLGGLGIWGIAKFADVNVKLDEAEKKATRLSATSNGLNERYEQLQKDFDQYEKLDRNLQQVIAKSDAIGQQVQSLQSNVSAINKRIGFAPSAELSPELQGHLNAELTRFDGYLRGVGYSPGDEPMTVSVVGSLKDNASSSFSFYEHKIEITKEYASQEGYLLVTYMPVVLRQRESGNPWRETPTYVAVGMGLSRYIPTSFLGHEISSYPTTYGSDGWPGSVSEQNVNDAGQALFMALWKLRATISGPVLDRAALRAWAETQGSYRDANYQRVFADRMIEDLPADRRGAAQSLLRERNIASR